MRTVHRLCLPSVACAGAGVVATATAAGTRSYYWPYSETFVPEDVRPSSFQSSPVPSVRKNIIREYALGPLFGARTPLCILGFFPGVEDGNGGAALEHHASSGMAGSSARVLARALVERKKALRVALAELLSCDVKDVELGQIIMAKEMMLYRAGTPETPRLADGPGSSAEAGVRRRSRYARRPISARAFVDVYVLDSMFETPEEKRSFSLFVQDRIVHHASEANSFDALRATTSDASSVSSVSSLSSSSSGVTSGKLSAAQRAAFQDDMEERARVLDCVSDLLELGVVHCEVPVKAEDVDGHDYQFTQLHGEEVDLDTAEQVLDRWDKRFSV